MINYTNVLTLSMWARPSVIGTLNPNWIYLGVEDWFILM